MVVKRVLIVATVAVVGLVGAYAGWNALRPQMLSFAAETVTQHFRVGGHAQGWSHGGRGHGLAMICSDRRDQRVDRAVALIESFVDFTPAQTAAWDALTTAARDSSQTIGRACEGLGEPAEQRTAPERLERLERLMTTGLDVVKRVRPAFDGFYGTLTDQQKAALDALASHRHGG